MPPDPKVAVGVSVAVEHEGHRLMVKRGGQQWYAGGYGTWAHPGGWLDFGETIADTAIREVREETGVVVAHPQVCLPTYEDANQDGSLWIVNLFVVCQYESGEPTVTEPEKCPLVAWVPLMMINRLSLFEPTRVFHEILTNHGS